ncbi:MAG TPA: high-potential iron-sulfur protein [Casimicrobiaceae bacterium]|nr:high-potential iron-sulfur protein [Casimicrobiaceae bacterium]
MLIGGAALGAQIQPAAAQTKLGKAAVKYQSTPSNGKDCDDCMQFVPGKTADAMGTCKVVEGSISPHGYCIAFVAKAPG